ncbi:unnamed protein product [Owenia fusiformis]|uniref:Uncharacterized protein n=1 Tax=Owenia fusiformis TaxID=6347 RepID=A0A8J1XKS5_OWEFU|nr:unnamed protein product [Owenia fusiformis]
MAEAKDVQEQQDKFLLKIGHQLGKDLNLLGIHLGFTNAEIDNIKQSNPHDAKQWGYDLLQQWTRRQPNQMQLLAEALRDVDRIDLAEEVEKYEASHTTPKASPVKIGQGKGRKSGENDMTCQIRVVTMDVSCDIHAQKMSEKHEDYDFQKRFKKQFQAIESLKPDVVNLQEIRYKKNLDLIKSLKEDNYVVHHFKNNDSDMSFNNCICVRKKGNWKEITSKHYWTTIIDGKPALSEDKNARVPAIEEQDIKGDPHGRCVGVVLLQHKELPDCKIIIATTHVVPFGKTKAIQQKASLSLADMACDIAGEDCNVIIAGDFNIFNDDRESGTFREIEEFSEEHKIREIPLKRLHIPGQDGRPYEIVTDINQIGTFTPWTSDPYSTEVFQQPLGFSKLDAIFASNSLECKDGVDVRPVLMYKGLNNLADMSDDEKDYDKYRYMFKDRLASDHFLLSATFLVK